MILRSGNSLDFLVLINLKNHPTMTDIKFLYKMQTLA